MLRSIGLVLPLELAVAMTFFPALRLGTRSRVAVLIAVGSSILLLPLLVPEEARVARLVTAITAALLCLKLVDLHIGVSEGVRPTAGTALRFLVNPFCFVQRRMELVVPQPRGSVVLRLVGSGAALFVSYLLISSVSRVQWPAVPLLFDHVAKSSLFFAGIVSMFTFASALVQLAGGVAPPPIHGLMRARSPADFWRRYNRCLRLFFHEDVFGYTGSWRSSVRATFMVFAISGLLHEYAFSMAAGRFQGYQSIFFLLQAAAVVLTLRLRARGAVAVAATIGTITFLLLSSVFFFASLHEVVRFYSHLP
jgi:hypothetical protein